jgi:hypothetical protein
MTRREVAEHFGMPEETVKWRLKNAGIRKNDPPVDPARIANAIDAPEGATKVVTYLDGKPVHEFETLDALVDDSVEAKRHAVKVKMQRAERAELQRRAETAESLVRDHELKRKHIRNGVAAALREVDVINIAEPRFNEDGWAAHAVIADPHVGLQVYGKESWTGENYHTDLAAERIIDAAARAAGWIDGMSGMLGDPRVIHYSIVGDLFHALQYATVSGRPMQVDGRARRVFEKVLSGVASAIATLAQVAPVEARITDGNHDGDLAFYVATALAGYFRSVPTVSVETSYNHQCSFYEGETLHVLDHGRAWAALDSKKVGADAAVILEEIGEMYPPHRFAKIWIGDKHSPQVAWPSRKTEVIRVPALASLDDYAQGLNYSHDFDAYVYALSPRGTIAHQGRLYEGA